MQGPLEDNFMLQLNTGQEGDLIVHKDVHEGRKRGGQLTLGTPLKIQVSGGGGTMKKELTFEDLDEIMARYVTPMYEKFQEVVRNRQVQSVACCISRMPFSIVSSIQIAHI